MLKTAAIAVILEFSLHIPGQRVALPFHVSEELLVIHAFRLSR